MTPPSLRNDVELDIGEAPRDTLDLEDVREN